MDWTAFYATSAGASATLVGLLFIGVQFNIDLFIGDPTNKWNAVARSTFEIFSLIFIFSLCFLFPTLSDDARSTVLLIGVGIGVVRAVGSWWPVARSVRVLLRTDQFAQTFWLLIAPLIIYLLLALSVVEYLLGRVPALDQTNIAFALVAMFAICLRNSWRLLFDVALERNKNRGKN